MYKIRALKSDDEYQTYSDSFYESISSSIGKNTKKIPMEYLKSSQVVGVFDQNDLMVAGYTLGHNSPYRLLEFVPEGAQYVLPDGFDWEHCCEIVCVWKKDFVSSFYTTRHFWPHIFSEFLSSGKKYLLGHNQSEKLDKYYGFMNPKTLYVGESTFGLQSRLFIYSVSKVRMIRLFARTVNSLIQYSKK